MPSNTTGRPRSWSEVQCDLIPAVPSHHLPLGRSTSQESRYEERCVDPVVLQPQELQRPMGTLHKALPRDVQGGNAEENMEFMPRSGDPTVSQGCGSCGGPCASPGSCRRWVCSVLTCRPLRVLCCTMLVTPSPRASSLGDNQEKISLRPHLGTNDPQIKNGSEGAGSDWSEDVYIRGVKVDIPRMEDEEFVLARKGSQNGSGGGGQFSNQPYSWNEEDLGDMTVGDLDSLITQKLLELYTEYQIEELARCTSDSVFLKKTGKISQLINDLAEEHQLEEQDAECRLVKGIIRISTRVSKKRPPYKKSHRNPSDSGNETMSNYQTSTISNNNDYDIQISKETDSDKNARNMRMNSKAECSENQISVCGNPLHRTSVRT
ncbi:hypothetical protein UPYG_G00336790 [Umbra pygmaea]|uniref:Keratinocyte differentiation factor 1 n=1 Tax=Umbra pygmaea TaxID=75934 RepID=A0ABD0VW27_UMBPY